MNNTPLPPLPATPPPTAADLDLLRQKLALLEQATLDSRATPETRESAKVSLARGKRALFLAESLHPELKAPQALAAQAPVPQAQPGPAPISPEPSAMPPSVPGTSVR
jgi:hypothetical protein